MKKYIEHLKQTANAAGICGILLLIRPLIYLVFSRKRDLNAYSAVDTSALIFILYAFVCFFVAYNTIKKSHLPFAKLLMTKTPLIWFILFTIYGAISMFWSVSFTLTGFRAFECMAMILLIVAIMQKLFTTYSLENIIDWSIMYVTVDIVFSLIRTMQWSTSISVLLESSQMMSTVFFFMALYYPIKKWYHYLIIIMAIFSGSTVSYIGMAAGSMSILWRKTRYKPFILIGVMIFSISVAIIGPEKVIKDTVFHDKKSISLEETSGRDHLMEVTIETVEKHPWGLGFFAGEPAVFYTEGLSAINAHNSLFSAGIGLGYLGILIMILFLSGVGLSVFSNKIPSHYKASLIGCYFAGFMQCMGNPALGSRVYGAWLPVTYLFILICSFYVYGKYSDKRAK